MSQTALSVRNRHPDYLIGLSGGAALAGAWMLPGSIACAILGLVSALLLVLAAQNQKRPYLTSYLIGVTSHCAAFYWLFFTIKNFGGFDALASSGIFFLFVTLSALQFPIFILLFRAAKNVIPWGALTVAGAWVSSETIAVKIFPWYLGHTQLALEPISRLASLGGAGLISFIMIAAASAVVNRKGRQLIGIIAIFGFLSIFGHTFNRSSAGVLAVQYSVAVVQANISLEEKHNMQFVVSNRQRYGELTNEALASGPVDLVIWPETVIQDWIPNSVGSRLHHPALADLPDNTATIAGALTFRSRKELFNSALAVLADGTVLPPYHKRILMPFGEYTPFGELFPWLAEINATAGGFTAGEGPGVFEFKNGLKVSPLICYEDILPRLGVEAANAGANVLVNLTNDAWFGDTVAPHQHHLIAAFRAIETGRYLIRSTNTGLTAIVNPRGETIASLPGYSEGVMRAEIEVSNGRTVYMALGDLPWWALSGLYCLLLIAVFTRALLR